jgi:hypothetical protein
VSGKRERKKHRKIYANELNNQGRQRTIVAYGNASVNSSMRGHPSVPQKVKYNNNKQHSSFKYTNNLL